MKRKTKLIIGLVLWLVLWALSLIVLPISSAKAEAPVLSLEEQPIEVIVMHFAEQYGVDQKLMLDVMKIESRGIQATVGDGGLSRGIFQYQKATFERHSKEFGEVLDYNSGYDQAKLASWAIANGKGNEWTAYRCLNNGGVYSFYSRQLKKHFTVTCKI